MRKYIPILRGVGPLVDRLKVVFVAVVLTGAAAACTLPGTEDPAVTGAVRASRACDAAAVALGSATDLHAADRMGLARTLNVDQTVVRVSALCEAPSPPDDVLLSLTLIEEAALNFLTQPGGAPQRVSAETIRIIVALAGRAYIFWQTYQAGQTVVTAEQAQTLWDGSAVRFGTARLAWEAEIGVAVDAAS